MHMIFFSCYRSSSLAELGFRACWSQLSSLSPIESNTRSPNLNPRKAKRLWKPDTKYVTQMNTETIIGYQGYKEPALSQK